MMIEDKHYAETIVKKGHTLVYTCGCGKLCREYSEWLKHVDEVGGSAVRMRTYQTPITSATTSGQG